MGPANPNLPCCHSCGGEGAPESFVLYRLELVCAACYEEHERKAAAEDDCCDDCGVMHVQLFEQCCGDMVCSKCVEARNDAAAERQEEAANEAYYGGECDTSVYERASQRAFNRSIKR